MNYINIVVYSILLISVLVGIQIAPKNKLREDSLSLDAMTSLKGLMAICVILHHISQKAAFQQTKTIPIFEHIGFLFVGVFFFCSGYGLYKSFSTKENYLKGFLKKRVLPIVISYYVMVGIYAIFYLIRQENFSIDQWICKLTGLTMINSQSWYVYVIIIMYIAFYFVFKNEKLRKHGLLILFLVIIAQGALFIFLNHFPWYIGDDGWWKNPSAFGKAPWWKRPCALLFEGEWWVNSTIGFFVGVFIAKNEKALTEYVEKNYLSCFVITTISFIAITFVGNYALKNISYWTEFGGNLGMKEKSICYIIQGFQVVMTILFVVLLMKKVFVKNKFYNFFGKASLEVYLIQELVLFSFAFLIEKGNKPIFKYHNYNLAIFAVWVILCVLIGAIIYRWINVSLTKKLKK